MSKEKIVLAYSGGLDTSVAIAWLKNKDYDVIACCIDVGEGKDLDCGHRSMFRNERRSHLRPCDEAHPDS